VGVIAGMDGPHDKRGYMNRSDMRHMDKDIKMEDRYKNDEEKMMKSTKMDHSTMDMSSMDPMDMSMRDMDSMMKGRTGDALNQAFLEGMIPHHQGAIDMAKYLAGSNKPELVKLGADIIAAQQKEIDQMNSWMKEWGYISTGSMMSNTGTSMKTDDAMRGHCQTMPGMMGCEKYK
jgi:uncharacterized protein (DUF305 family)